MDPYPFGALDLVVHPEKKDGKGRNGHCLAAFFTAKVILL